VEPLNAQAHARDLFEANSLGDGRNWTYLSPEPFADYGSFERWVQGAAEGEDPMFFTVVDAVTEKAVGVASYMRIAPEAGCIEVGNINFSPLLQRHAAATECMFLMMRNVFALGYRRYEWKCDSLNAPSRSAAARFGFSYEGLFRQALVYKGRNRDTAWFSIIDSEWPALEKAYQTWLAPENFDTEGRQRMSLRELTQPLLSPRVG
jgi:RimJ/RimL family protein N-acetyltransferase